MNCFAAGNAPKPGSIELVLECCLDFEELLVELLAGRVHGATSPVCLPMLLLNPSVEIAPLAGNFSTHLYESEPDSRCRHRSIVRGCARTYDAASSCRRRSIVASASVDTCEPLGVNAQPMRRTVNPPNSVIEMWGSCGLGVESWVRNPKALVIRPTIADFCDGRPGL
jgi:hypothetical protein